MNTVRVPVPFLGEIDWNQPEPPLVTIAFRRHRGDSYPQAVATARAATLHLEHTQDGAHYHIATFGNDARQAAAASFLIHLLWSIKGTLIFDSSGNVLPVKYSVKRVLDCFSQSSLVGDSRAYCHSVIDDPFTGRGHLSADRYVLPCRLVHSWHRRFDVDHPSSPRDLMLAAGVEVGCHWCPNFNADDFRRVDYPPENGLPLTETGG